MSTYGRYLANIMNFLRLAEGRWPGFHTTIRRPGADGNLQATITLATLDARY